MTNPYRAMCAELLAWAERTSSHYYKQADVISRALALLDQPVAEEPKTIEGILTASLPWVWESIKLPPDLSLRAQRHLTLRPSPSLGVANHAELSAGGGVGVSVEFNLTTSQNSAVSSQ